MKSKKSELHCFVYLQEYQVGNKSLVIEDTNIKQAVYIFKCQDSTVQVKGKVNSIILGK
jgi:adenylyl cyclase-associated protein